MDFDTLVTAVREKKDLEPYNPETRLLSFDPGHTTGWCLYVGTKQVHVGQIITKSIPQCVENVENLFAETQPTAIVMEDYRVYKWRAQHHAGSDMLTTRVIGSIETIAVQHFMPEITKQPAHIAKRWCTDEKLKQWEMYVKGQKHARDAVRHATYFILFGAIRKADRQRITVG